MGRSAKALRAGNKRRRIVLVDDHPMVRERLAEILDREADLAVCGEAEDRHEALAVVQSKRPDLVIVDLTLKNSDGLELIKDIHSRWPRLQVLVLSMHDESLYAERAIRAGARGYITKQEATRDILLAVRRILGGDIYVNDRIATRLLGRLAAHPDKMVAAPAEMLADRELQVFELTGRGLNTREIAARLRVSVKTIETYRARIRQKLNLQDGSELLQLAISWAHKR